MWNSNASTWLRHMEKESFCWGSSPPRIVSPSDESETVPILPSCSSQKPPVLTGFVPGTPDIEESRRRRRSSSTSTYTNFESEEEKLRELSFHDSPAASRSGLVDDAADWDGVATPPGSPKASPTPTTSNPPSIKEKHRRVKRAIGKQHRATSALGGNKRSRRRLFRDLPTGASSEQDRKVVEAFLSGLENAFAK
ncbi:hypothetical protein A3770_03p19990 [Chloropicon primus]|uniref:Uncharacterized protein n=1 Tax=Chloropicon primus TaxID=1764295 RepID=A0A5B8MGL4_9CHLO|nr:hypothetical protein A3770_03p19990 [Chloropicon primus]|mmetsp:Transcript_3942/g.11432  ORF Transcript_3942/g.11432 Transcript_3942/m.11432 type:complete len:195 (-) Transcript_3942:374-958(-)|eukprot:QDZ19481.1 hypothetical protein A3770_03p19990 [Chloropicon primus]